jgi:hypothetical protein
MESLFPGFKCLEVAPGLLALRKHQTALLLKKLLKALSKEHLIVLVQSGVFDRL